MNRELYHHGVKGMRWGVITKKSSSSNGGASERASRKQEKAENKAMKKEAKKAYKNSFTDAKRLSDEELRSRINRMNLENNYRRAVRDQYNDSLGTGRRTVNKYIDRSVDTAVNNLSKETIGKGSKEAGKALYKGGSTAIAKLAM